MPSRGSGQVLEVPGEVGVVVDAPGAQRSCLEIGSGWCDFFGRRQGDVCGRAALRGRRSDRSVCATRLRLHRHGSLASAAASPCGPSTHSGSPSSRPHPGSVGPGPIDPVDTGPGGTLPAEGTSESLPHADRARPERRAMVRSGCRMNVGRRHDDNSSRRSTSAPDPPKLVLGCHRLRQPPQPAARTNWGDQSMSDRSCSTARFWSFAYWFSSNRRDE